jgi:hypothetical protein
MPICLPAEYETEVYGTCDGFITITQKQGHEEVSIHLSVHQFETIFNYEKRVIKEARKPDEQLPS